MARFVDVIDLPVSPQVAFEALADFSRTALWDPGVVHAARLDGPKLEVGSRFEVHVSLLGRTSRLEYAITEMERPRRVVLEGGDAWIRLVDEIAFVPRHGGTRVVYEVRCEPLGLFRLADPLLALALPRIGQTAAEGLRAYGHRLAARAEATPAAAATNDDTEPFHAPVEARDAGLRHQEGANP